MNRWIQSMTIPLSTPELLVYYLFDILHVARTEHSRGGTSRIVEQGTRESLLAQRGLYCHLQSLQNGGYRGKLR